MDSILPNDLPGLDEANAQLDRLEAEERANAAALGEQDDSANPGQRAAQAEGDEDPSQAGEETDTPATTDKQEKEQQTPPKDPKAEAEAAAKAEADKAKADQGKSRFARNQERLQGGWKELNDGKSALQKEREALEAERASFQKERADSEMTPEQYEDAAAKFEEAGKLELAELSRERAKELRANPPAKRKAEADAKVETARREWTLKAGIDFPEVAKDRSAVQVRVAQLQGEYPELKQHPKGLYLAAALASAESAAASVPTLKASLAKAEARVAELQKLTTPASGGGAPELQGEKSFEQMSDNEQYAELLRQGRELGTLR